MVEHISFLFFSFSKSKRCSLCRGVRRIKIKVLNEEVKITVVGKASDWNSFPQNNGSWEGFRLELNSYFLTNVRNVIV